MHAYQLIKNTNAREAFRLVELPSLNPKDGEIKIAVEAFGLNYADVMARQGLYPDCPPLPAVIGYDVVGRIIELGPQCNTLKVGDRVTAMTRFGGYATEAITSEKAAAKITESMPITTALSLTTQYSTAWYMATKIINILPGDSVLIHAAAGGVGQALVQIALHKGATVFGTAGSEEKVKLLRDNGVHHPINYRIAPFEQEIKKIMGNHKLDIVFDNIGGSSVKKAFHLIGAGGRMVLYGAADMSGSKYNLFKRIKTGLSFGIYHPAQFMMASKSLVGVNMLKIADSKPDILSLTLHEVIQALDLEILKPAAGHQYVHHQLGEAHQFLEDRKTMGKIALSWNE